LVGMKAGRCRDSPPNSVMQLVGTEYHDAAASCRLDVIGLVRGICNSDIQRVLAVACG
jgi:hypothetical protein